MSYLKNMINGMTALEVIPHDSLYIPNPARLIVADTQDFQSNDRLVDTSIAITIWTGTTDGASVANELNDDSENFILNSTQAQAGAIVGAGKFVKKGNVVLNTTDSTEHIVSGVKDSNASFSSKLLLDSGVPTGKAYTVQGDGFVSRYGVKAGDIVINRGTPSMAQVVSVKDDRTILLSANIFATTGEKYELYSANPPQGAGADPSQAQGCLVYVGTSTSIKQDVEQTAGGTDDPRYVTIKVKTVGGQDVIFNNFPVGEVLPVQVVQVYATPAITNARIVALW